MKVWLVAAMLPLAWGLAAAPGFVETFAGPELGGDWSLDYKVKCSGIAWERPIKDSLTITGLENARPGAEAYLDRDANYAAGNFRLIAELDFQSAAAGQPGAFRFQLLTENGEKLIEGAIEREAPGGPLRIGGNPGHSGRTVARTPLVLSAPATSGTLSIVRENGHYEVRFNDRAVYTDHGDTAPAASFRLAISGGLGTLVLKRLTLTTEK